MTYSTRSSRRLAAPRHAVYRALLDAGAVAAWRVPDGMTAHVHEFDPREDGRFRVSLTYESRDAVGKSAAHTDTYHGRFVRLVPDETVVESIEFESADPEVSAPMTMTTSLTDIAGGTEVTMAHDGIPDSVSRADNETGTRMALDRLAALLGTDW